MKQSIGNQVKLPFKTAFAISLQGIRIRLGRALVTLSGVLLGIAFLMSILTTQLIQNTTEAQRTLKDRTTLMITSVRSEVGTLNGRKIAIYQLGELTEYEKRFIAAMQSKANNAKIEMYGSQTLKGVTKVKNIDDLGKDSDLLLVLGDKKPDEKINLDTIVKNLNQPIVIDGIANRSEVTIPNSQYSSFFGDSTAQQVSKEEAEQRAKQDRFRYIWIVIISLLVTVIGITNALLMSVTERFKEIGTMKCLGALSSFIRQLFIIESALIGVVGSILGVIVGALFPLIAFGFNLQFGVVFGAMNYPMLLLAGLFSIIAGTVLSVLAAIYPANFASKMVPAMALRSNV